jgi:hypothetical protein
MALFCVECQEDGVFSIRTEREDEEVCSVIFEDIDMGGALDLRAQRALMLSLARAMQKVCTDHWRRESGD